MKPKSNRKPGPVDQCMTPSYALDPLLPYLHRRHTVWEPAKGEGHMVRALEHLGFSVIASGFDVDETGIEMGTGEDFFEYEPDEWWNVLITNPPYSIKRPWLRRCYELGKPFALLLPVENLGSGEVQGMMKQYGGEVLLLNRRVNFIMRDPENVGRSPKKSAAQFPTYWHCWHLLPTTICYGEIIYRDVDQLIIPEVLV